MIFKQKHNSELYNTLLLLSRNIFFYKKIKLEDSYETRVYLMFFHYSIILFIMKKKGYKPDQENYNNLFFHIESNLREMGFGDVSVNKKMKDLNKIFYDILIKISGNLGNFDINDKLIHKYFDNLKNSGNKKQEFAVYLTKFYNFCFELNSDNMIQNLQQFKY